MRTKPKIDLGGEEIVEMAVERKDLLRIRDDGIHPTCGDWRITAVKFLPVNGYDLVKHCPKVLEYKGTFFVWLAWNSDTGDVYFREAKSNEVARKVK